MHNLPANLTSCVIYEIQEDHALCLAFKKGTPYHFPLTLLPDYKFLDCFSYDPFDFPILRLSPAKGVYKLLEYYNESAKALNLTTRKIEYFFPKMLQQLHIVPDDLFVYQTHFSFPFIPCPKPTQYFI